MRARQPADTGTLFYGSGDFCAADIGQARLLAMHDLAVSLGARQRPFCAPEPPTKSRCLEVQKSTSACAEVSEAGALAPKV